ncbi:MAG: pyridoxamine 5'-phosphate oxidase family protein [Anaerolineaceae bacterium]|nr:pyridoxamine 5'-phosphate oxidase family protein [Anaerolineaceae bacterium]
MTDKNARIPFAQVTRKDRTVEDEAWIRAMLHGAATGCLATCQQDQPYLTTNLFVYDESQNVIYLHSGRKGRILKAVEANQRVCFSVSQMGRLLPGASAPSMSVEYASVVVFGNATILSEPEESKRALQMLVDKYFPHLQPGRDYRPTETDELAGVAVYRIDIEQWSGKRKQAEPDFPGAFVYNR